MCLQYCLVQLLYFLLICHTFQSPSTGRIQCLFALPDSTFQFLCRRRVVPASKTLLQANLATDFPCISKMWDYDRNDKNPEDFRPQSNVSVWWHCSFGHIWYAQINTMTRSKGKKCPYCTGKRPIPGETDLASCHPEMLKEWDYQKNKLLPEEVTSLSHKCVWWICPNGHSFRRRIANHTLRGGCPICQKAKKKH